MSTSHARKTMLALPRVFSSPHHIHSVCSIASRGVQYGQVEQVLRHHSAHLSPLHLCPHVGWAQVTFSGTLVEGQMLGKDQTRQAPHIAGWFDIRA